MGPGRARGRGHAYIRHGTPCLAANLEVWRGCLSAPALGPPRNERDFARHIARAVAADPLAGWVFNVDHLNTHQSEGLVLYVAEACGIKDDLGEKEKTGVRKSPESRAESLSEPGHRLRLVSTPKHGSWLNQIDSRFSILVRELPQRSSFKSLEDLEERALEFIDYFHRTMSKPIRWRYSPRPLPEEVPSG
jgi:hypothetical protein